jgi:hypothetical protein
LNTLTAPASLLVLILLKISIKAAWASEVALKASSPSAGVGQLTFTFAALILPGVAVTTPLV